MLREIGTHRGSFARIRPLAHSAIVAGSASPVIKAAKIARPDTPMISVATAANLMLARSNTPCTRLTSRLRSWTRLVRYRVRSRQSRYACGGIKLAASRP
jgi:hypothetical protein